MAQVSLSLRGALFCLAYSLFVCTSALAQQTWPTKPIKLIVAQGAGSPTDVLGRVLAEHMGRNLERSVVVDNRAGADGLIGMEALAKSAPDGYTIGLASQANFAIEPLLRKSMPYDAIRDFSAIAVVVDDTGGLAWFANATMPFKNLPEMINYANANPGKVTYSTNASSHVMLGEWLRKRAGIDIVQVPYKSATQSYQDVVSGVVATAISAPAILAPFVKTGQLRFIALANPRRAEEWKDVGTIAEIYPDFAMSSWVVLAAPAGLPRDITSRLNRAVAAALGDAEYQKQVRKLRWVNHLGARTPKETEAFIQAGRDNWASVIKTIGLTQR